MSRNSKNARLHREARERKKTKGFVGPAKTTPKHGKVNRTKYNRADRAGPSVVKPAQEV